MAGRPTRACRGGRDQNFREEAQTRKTQKQSHYLKMGYFKLTFQGELEFKKSKHSAGHDTLTILFYRTAPSPYESSTAYVYSSSKYVTFIRDLFENDNKIRIRSISRKNLESETKDLTPYGVTHPNPTWETLPTHIPSYLEEIFDRHQDAVLEYFTRRNSNRNQLKTNSNPEKRRRLTVKTV